MWSINEVNRLSNGGALLKYTFIYTSKSVSLTDNLMDHKFIVFGIECSTTGQALRSWQFSPRYGQGIKTSYGQGIKTS